MNHDGVLFSPEVGIRIDGGEDSGENEGLSRGQQVMFRGLLPRRWRCWWKSAREVRADP